MGPFVCGDGNVKRLQEPGKAAGRVTSDSHQKSTNSDYCCQLGLTCQKPHSPNPTPTPNITSVREQVPETWTCVGNLRFKLQQTVDKAGSYLRQAEPRLCSKRPWNTTLLAIYNNQPGKPDMLPMSQTYRKPHYLQQVIVQRFNT